MMDAIRWNHTSLDLLDQTKLPTHVTYLSCRTWQSVRHAISILAVRGAPAIGVAAAYGVVLAFRAILQDKPDINVKEFVTSLHHPCMGLIQARPTAINLAWAVNRMEEAARQLSANVASGSELAAQLEQLAIAIHKEDLAINAGIAEHGAALLSRDGHPLTILTHCNAGALATTGIGTALGIIRSLHKQAILKMVYADETRPLLQGARLTAYELMADHVPVTLITDSMAAWIMKTKHVDAVIVGADRITANGDTANKIGTYGVSILAKEHHIPFYVAAPTSTFDRTLPCGDNIPIEERKPEEVRSFQGMVAALPETPVCNPAFDVTPHKNITAIITESGVIMAPDEQKVNAFFKEKERL